MSSLEWSNITESSLLNYVSSQLGLEDISQSRKYQSIIIKFWTKNSQKPSLHFSWGCRNSKSLFKNHSIYQWYNTIVLAVKHTIANQASSAFQIEKLRPGPLLYHLHPPLPWAEALTQVGSWRNFYRSPLWWEDGFTLRYTAIHWHTMPSPDLAFHFCYIAPTVWSVGSIVLDTCTTSGTGQLWRGFSALTIAW